MLDPLSYFSGFFLVFFYGVRCSSVVGAFAHGAMGRRIDFSVFVVGVDYGMRCSSVVRVFADGAMGRRINPSWWTH